MTGETPRFWPGFLLLDVAPMVAVGFAVFYLLCRYVGDVYPVRSGSMEPTIHGDPLHGDWVLVNKLAWTFSRPEPFETVVIRGGREGDDLIVKRCVVVAGDNPVFLRIHDGDLYRRQDDTGSFGLPIVKDPVEFADLRIPVFRHPDEGCKEILEEFMRLPPGTVPGSDGAFDLQPVGESTDDLLRRVDPGTWRPDPRVMAPVIPGFLATNKAVDTSYLTPDGRREWRDVNFYPDVGIELECTAAGGAPAAMLFVLEYRDKDYGLLWDRDGIRLVVGGKPADRAGVGTTALAGLDGDRPSHLVFGYQDRHLYLIRDGVKLFHEPVSLEPNDLDYRRPNRLHVGLAGSAALTVRRLVVFHDLPVTSVAGRHGAGGGDYVVPKDHMFLLGDNPPPSQDSRGALGAVPLSRLVGRPTAILAPARRARFFVR